MKTACISVIGIRSCHQSNFTKQPIVYFLFYSINTVQIKFRIKVKGKNRTHFARAFCFFQKLLNGIFFPGSSYDIGNKKILINNLPNRFRLAETCSKGFSSTKGTTNHNGHKERCMNFQCTVYFADTSFPLCSTYSGKLG